MSLNLYELIIETANNLNQNITLAEVGVINKHINNLIERGINQNWIIDNLECLM